MTSRQRSRFLPPISPSKIPHHESPSPRPWEEGETKSRLRTASSVLSEMVFLDGRGDSKTGEDQRKRATKSHLLLRWPFDDPSPAQSEGSGLYIGRGDLHPETGIWRADFWTTSLGPLRADVWNLTLYILFSKIIWFKENKTLSIENEWWK